jgi:hypothetical protein
MEYAVDETAHWSINVNRRQRHNTMEVQMARDHKPGEEVTSEAPDNTVTPADVAAGDAVSGQAEGNTTAAAPEEAKNDERFVFVNAPDGQGGSTRVKRAEAIRALWQGTVTPYNPEGKKHTRGAITKLISEWGGKKIPYQIVFAGTKGLAGGPPKEETAAPASETPAAE